ncbi:MAG TPA: pyridoxal-phosphate dependent enzyme [Solirubrobacteraceae bacterium]|jgi:threonine dehydratase|nr:pyridoxal-phosphate dependent enzyme [Solirubrobacteraceae bacterium]
MTSIENAQEAPPTADQLLAQIDVQRAAAAIDGRVVHTPTLPSPELSERVGTPVELKAECLQRAGSFKVRGALNKVSTLGADACLVAASAGNHGRAVAEAARTRGVQCTVFMPSEAPVSKVTAIQELGAEVHLEGASVDETLALARDRAQETGATFVHPFDDVDVIAGQATLGLELLADVPDLARVLVPVGGGGLASGIGAALRGSGRRVQLIGVQAEVCAPYARELNALVPGRADAPDPAPGATIADGIAIKRPGSITRSLLGELLDGVVTVGEEEIADAIVFLAERSKLIVEGAGAVAVAAVRSSDLPAAEGTTVAVLSGGNIDSGLLASLMLRHETEVGRRVRIYTRVADRPGGLAELLGLVARTRANVIGVEHLRQAVPLRVRETGLELTLETRGPGHTDEVLAALRAAGYDVTLG